MFKEVKKNKKLYLQIVDQIKDNIDKGVLNPGERLPPERELSNQFGLSRSSVREAITALEIMGLVEVRPGLGTFISNRISANGINLFSADYTDLEESASPTDMLETREIFETAVIRLAAQRVTSENLEQMRNLLEMMDKLSLDDMVRFEELDSQFHLLIAQTTNNEVLLKVIEIINNLRNTKIWESMKYRSLVKEGRIEKYKIQHWQMFEALKNRDSEQAVLIMKNHLTVIKRDIFEE